MAGFLGLSVCHTDLVRLIRLNTRGWLPSLRCNGNSGGLLADSYSNFSDPRFWVWLWNPWPLDWSADCINFPYQLIPDQNEANGLGQNYN